MIKSDAHMERIRQRLLDESAGIKKSEDKRKEREGKKFGKQVQIEKLKEREKSKKEMEERLKGLKRSMFFPSGQTTSRSRELIYNFQNEGMSWTIDKAAKMTLTLRLKMPYLTVLQNEGNLAVVRVSHARCEIRSTVLAVLPEDQSKIPGNPRIILTRAAAEVEVDLEAVVVEVRALEVEEEAPNVSASRDE
jgi:hypothetical protein